MKKLFAVLMAVLMVLTLAGCGSKKEEAAPAAEIKTVYIMGPSPDHGWTAQAGTYADQKAKEITEAGTYKGIYFAASSGEEQVDQCNQIIANGDAAVVVMMALEDSAAAGQKALAEANIPFISFDRIIDETAPLAALNTSGDNWAVGAGIGYWLQTKGMTPTSTIVTLYGDNGTVCSRRADGFRAFLTGNAVADPAASNAYTTYVDEKLGEFTNSDLWTDADVDAALNTYSVVCNWSADGAKDYLDQKLEEIIDKATANGGKLYVYSMDDEMTFGLLGALYGLTDEYKAKAEALEIYTSAIGGMQELYDVMTGKSADTNSETCAKYFDDIMSMYFSPKMMKDVIDLGLDYLAGNWNYKTGDGFYTPVFMVTKDTAATTEGFTGH